MNANDVVGVLVVVAVALADRILIVPVVSLCPVAARHFGSIFLRSALLLDLFILCVLCKSHQSLVIGYDGGWCVRGVWRRGRDQ